MEFNNALAILIISLDFDFKSSLFDQESNSMYLFALSLIVHPASEYSEDSSLHIVSLLSTIHFHFNVLMIFVTPFHFVSSSSSVIRFFKSSIFILFNTKYCLAFCIRAVYATSRFIFFGKSSSKISALLAHNAILNHHKIFSKFSSADHEKLKLILPFVSQYDNENFHSLSVVS
jgi:hypothetical protein